MLSHRVSKVGHIHINLITFSGVLQLGDSTHIKGTSKALAVQRTYPIYNGKEGFFSWYSVFFEPLVLPIIDEPVHTTFHNENPLIKVGNINILGLTAASVFHVGNTRHASMETRIKHIRQMI
ncbi:spore germination protein GerPE [Bacillus aquiflavi]|uniref:Spore germination protein GerPE n=1 Tax=Bacillus aquiflavi TaxID=2672567 RepID=A0A6B3W1J0_9BACI|nr:spore germination protein GerPE [Bacillus aquiflavi]MBA4538743.1 spore germination protein GerPE [Bacillus aquiflavi]NEY83102.1 spore germination protein GerPE [Bacillus aquiflavi]